MLIQVGFLSYLMCKLELMPVEDGYFSEIGADFPKPLNLNSIKFSALQVSAYFNCDGSVSFQMLNGQMESEYCNPC